MASTEMAAGAGRVYKCRACAYSTGRKSNWQKHIATAKHKRLIQSNGTGNQHASFVCPHCHREYKHLASLSRHRRECQGAVTSTVSNELGDLKRLVTEMANRPVNQTTNVNVFLTHACPSALDIGQFMETLRLTQADLLYTQRNGYVEGMSQVLIRGLKGMSPLERPIHCKDGSVGLYIKDAGKWAKDGDGKLLGQQLKLLTQKQMECLRRWEDENPGWRESEVRTRMYLDLVSELLGPTEDEVAISRQVEKRIGPSTLMSDVEG